MKVTSHWEERLRFMASPGGPGIEGRPSHRVRMDAKSPLGEDSAISPKQLLLAAVTGCTGMDVASLLRKFKQSPTRFEVTAEAELTDKHPVVFREIHLIYRFEGELDASKLKEAVHLSQSLYCGVSAIVAQAVRIRYDIELNGQAVASGESQFPSLKG